jgi:hypothetical protein
MNILDNEIFIFILQELINEDDNELINGFKVFFNLLIDLKKKIYIIDKEKQKNIKLYDLYILNSNIISSDNDNDNDNEYDCYMKIIKENIKIYELYEMIVFTSSYKNWIESKNIIYNCVFVNDSLSKNYNIIPDNIIFDFKNIENFEYTKRFEYIPFYISSKTNHRNKWIELKKYFPIQSSWIQYNKSKEDLTTIDKTNICDNIEKDISECSFGIFYCEKNEEFHIGSLIEIGLLLSKSKKIFVCGENIYKNEVLFNFNKLFNYNYINNFNLYKTFKKIQYEINSDYLNFKKNITKII